MNLAAGSCSRKFIKESAPPALPMILQSHQGPGHKSCLIKLAKAALVFYNRILKEIDARTDERSQPTAHPSTQVLTKTASLQHPHTLAWSRRVWLDPYASFGGPLSSGDACPMAVLG